MSGDQAFKAGRRAGPGRDLWLAFGWLIWAEWTKARTARTAVWALGAAVAAWASLIALSTSIYASQGHGLPPAGHPGMQAHALRVILQPAVSCGQVMTCVLGVTAIASEYATGMIQASVLLAPRRVPLLAAKALVLGVGVFVSSAAAAVLPLVLGSDVLHTWPYVALADTAVAQVLLGFALSMALTAAFALGVASLVRHTASAVTGTLVAVIVLPYIAAQLPRRAGAVLGAYLPAGSYGQGVTPTGNLVGLPSPWHDLGVRCGWALAVLALAAIRLRRADLPPSQLR